MTTTTIAAKSDAVTELGQILFDQVSTDEVGVSKIMLGATGSNDGFVSTGTPLPVSDAGGSLTVDAPVGTPVFVRLSDGSSAISTLPVSLASVPSHAVTNAGTFAVQSTIAAAATNIAKAEDVAAADGDVGVPSMAVRKATPANTSSTDGYYEMLQMSAGRLWTSTVVDTALPAGTNAIGKLASNSGVTIGAVEIASGQTVAAVTSITNAVAVTDNSGSLTVDDGSGSLTVDNSGTFAVQAAQSGTWSVTNVSGTVSLPTGAATAAKQPALGTAGTASSDVLSVQGIASMTPLQVGDNSASLTVDAPVGTPVFVRLSDGSSAISTLPVSLASVPSHAVTNSGTFATQATLQSGTNYAGKVRLTDGTTDTDIRDLTNSNALNVAIVDGSGDQITSFGGGTQYTEDAAAAANPTGTALIMVRDDALSGSLTTTDGDNVAARGNNKGELYVKHTDAIPITDNSGSLTVDNNGTFAVQATLQSGTNGIGKLTSNSGVTIGAVEIAAAQTLGTVSTITNVVHVDDNSSSLTVDNGGTFAVQVTSTVPGTGSNNLGKAEDAAHASGDTGVMALSVRKDTAAATADTDGDYQPLITDSTGKLHVNVGNTVTVGSHAVTNAGTFAVQVDGSALASLQLIDDPVIADDSAFTPATSKVMMAGFEADESSTDSVDEGDAGAARMTLDRKQIVTVQPHTKGGLSIFRSLDIDETEEDVKTSAGQVYGFYIFNAATSVRYVKFYNATAANVTVGTTTPVLTLPVPAASSGGVGFNVQTNIGIAFDTAICVAATTGLADNDTGAPSANDVIINVLYS